MACRTNHQTVQHILAVSFLSSDWRRANVTPLFKRGNKHSLFNYPSISLTTLVVKCLEHLVHARISELLDTNNKLNCHQHRFCKGQLHHIQLFTMTNKWEKSLDRGVSTHEIRLNGVVRGNLLYWICDREKSFC